MTTAIVGGVFSVLGVLVAAFFALRGQRGQTKVTEIAQILEGYRDIVATLQSEVKRLEERIETMNVEMEACEKRNAAMETQLAELKQAIKKLNGGKP